MQFEGSKDEKARQKRKGIIIGRASYNYILYIIDHLSYTGATGHLPTDGRKAGRRERQDRQTKKKKKKERTKAETLRGEMIIIMIISHFADRALSLDCKSLSQ